MPVAVRTFLPADVQAVFDLQQRYARAFPGGQVLPGEYYLSPAFEHGQRVFCAEDDQGSLVAYAPVYAQIIDEAAPAHHPHSIWTEIKAGPDLPDPTEVKDLLLAQVLHLARQLTEPLSCRPVRVVFEYNTQETPAIEYVQSRGFTHGQSVFSMIRDLNEPIPAAQSPAGIHICPWKMESEAEQRAYVAARNACFPEAPVSLGEWQYFMRSPMWAAGTSIAALDGSEVAGNVTVYWDDNENHKAGRKSGYTEYVFVRPEWRGRGIARAMLCEALQYLKNHGMEQAKLGVAALNENALSLYKSLGYRVVQESRFYQKFLQQEAA